jgi:hypothetical protein
LKTNLYTTPPFGPHLISPGTPPIGGLIWIDRHMPVPKPPGSMRFRMAYVNYLLTGDRSYLNSIERYEMERKLVFPDQKTLSPTDAAESRQSIWRQNFDHMELELVLDHGREIRLIQHNLKYIKLIVGVCLERTE